MLRVPINIASLEVSDSAVLLYIVMVNNSKGGLCQLTSNQLSHIVGHSTRHVNRLMAELVSHSLISRAYESSRHIYHYAKMVDVSDRILSLRCNDSAKRLAFVIAMNCTSSVCSLSHIDLMRITKSSRGGIYNKIKMLEMAGFLRIEKDGGRNVYCVGGEYL